MRRRLFKEFTMISAMMLASGCTESADRNSAPFPLPTSKPTNSVSNPTPRRTRPLASEGRDVIAEPFTRADRSFSKYPFNSTFDPVEAGLKLARPQCIEEEFACEWTDDHAVAHIFDNNQLAIKLMLVAGRDGEYVPALAIGKARKRRDVLRKIDAFLPELNVTCLMPEESGEGPGLSSCGASFKNGGWIKLLFDNEDRLVLVRIDAFQIN